MATKCIICGKDKTGTKVSEDFVIQSIRRIKQALHMAQNNRLVVCKDCMPEHLKRRANFEQTLVRYGALGVIIAVVLLIISLNLNTLAIGLFLVVLMLLLALLSYSPSLTSYPEQKKKKK